MKEREFLLSSLCMLYVQMPASKDPTTPPTKRCRLSLLTNSALIIESQWEGMGGAGSQPMSTAVHITWPGAQMNFGDLPPYLTYHRPPAPSLSPSLFSARKTMGPATLYCPFRLLYIFLCPETCGTWHPFQCSFFSTETRGICYPSNPSMACPLCSETHWTWHPSPPVTHSLFLWSEIRKAWHSSQALYTHYYLPLLGDPWDLSSFLFYFPNNPGSETYRTCYPPLSLFSSSFSWPLRVLYDMDFKD